MSAIGDDGRVTIADAIWLSMRARELLPVNEKAQAIVDDFVRRNMPKPTGRRLLGRRGEPLHPFVKDPT